MATSEMMAAEIIAATTGRARIDRDAPEVPARADGSPPPRAALVAQLRLTVLLGDVRAERILAQNLGRTCIARGVHIGEALALLTRALDLAGEADDAVLRNEIGEILAGLGRHGQAGDLLAQGRRADEALAFDRGLSAGEAYARAGDAGRAAALYRQLAEDHPGAPEPLERLAAIAPWSEAVSPERAADAWIEAAARHGDSDEARCDVARAFEIAPGYEPAAQAYAAALERDGRLEAADEVWREHGALIGASGRIAARRFARAKETGAYTCALCAALDLFSGAPEHDVEEIGRPSDSPGSGDPEAALAALLQDPAAIEDLDAYPDEGRPIGQALAAAARTKSAMGRADSLSKVSARLTGSARGVIAALAAESYAAAGNRARALKAARQACSIAPWLARPAAALLSLGLDDDATAIELEAAIAHLPGRARIDRLLADQARASGRVDVALLWLRRALAIRPGDPALLRELLGAAASAGGPCAADLCAAAIERCLAEPCPAEAIDEGLAAALDALVAADPMRAAVVARDLLAALGPTAALLAAIERAALAASDHALGAELALRRAAADTSDPGPSWLRAAELAAPNDPEAAAAHLSQAAMHRALAAPIEQLAADIEAALERLEGGARSDARIDLAAARAWVGEYGDDDDYAERRWRELAVLRWDLAGDVHGAEEAAYYACSRDREHGASLYAALLRDRGGAELALELVENRVNLQAAAEDTGCSGRILAEAAGLADSLGQPDRAESLALGAVRYDPSCSDAVARLDQHALDRSARGESDEAARLLDTCYRALADGALGCYGVCSAHYRCARLLERLERLGDALPHALAAFEALPRLGAGLRLLARLSEVADQDGKAVLGQALARSLDRAGDALGAQTAVAVALMAATALADGRLCVEAALRALDLDPAADLESLLPHLDVIATDEAAAATLLHRINDLRADGGAPAGHKQLTAQLYLRIGGAMRSRPPIEDAPSSRRPQSPAGSQPPPAEREEPRPDSTPPWEESDADEAEQRGDHEAVAAILARKIAEAADPGEQRRLRLRRAAVLERRLGDLSGACRELEAVLKLGEDGTALRYLAELRDRQAQHTRAAKLWLRASKLSTSLEDKLRDVARCCQALLDGGQPHRAYKLLDATADLPLSEELSRLKQEALAALEARGKHSAPPRSERDEGARAEPEPAHAPLVSVPGESAAGDGWSGQDWFDAPEAASLRGLRWSSSPPPADTRLDSGGPPAADELDWSAQLPARAEPIAAPPAANRESGADAPADPIAELERELERGSYRAGERLCAEYERQGGHDREILQVRRRQAQQKRGDVPTLEKLLAAARADQDEPYAQAVQHVLGAFRGDDGAIAPALEDLPVHPEATTRLLFGPLDGTVCEVLGIVCRAGLFRKELADYRIEAEQRVPPASSGALGQLLGALGRLLDLDGVRVFRQRKTGSVSYRVALVWPPGALIDGDVDHASPVLRYAIGGALCAATPACALPEALAAEQLDDLVQALSAAFGPVRRDDPVAKHPARALLAQQLWERVQGASERRARDLCQDRERTTAAIARQLAARVRRRVGLFASGDLLTAVAQTAAELALPIALPLRGSDGLRDLCAHEDVADLVDLALDRGFAEARWRMAPGPASAARMTR